MPLSSGLQKDLKRGFFPLTSSSGIKLWNELISAMESKPKETAQEVKNLMNGVYNHDLSGTYFGATMTVNQVPVAVTFEDFGKLLGAMHERLCSNHGVASRDPVQSLIQRVRKIAIDNGVVKESNVQLGATDPHTQMGTGLTTTDKLTFVPDSSLGVDFGSTPSQKEIGTHAPPWESLKKRRHEKRPVIGQPRVIGRKPHYVLAHLLNHNVNGSGSDTKNVVPFFADANTEMERVAETYLKELVLKGIPVDYEIELGPTVGSDANWYADMQTALGNCTTDAEKEVLQTEQYLPQYLTITLKAWDGTQWVTIVNAKRVDNYVPTTVPVI